MTANSHFVLFKCHVRTSLKPLYVRTSNIQRTALRFSFQSRPTSAATYLHISTFLHIYNPHISIYLHISPYIQHPHISIYPHIYISTYPHIYPHILTYLHISPHIHTSTYRHLPLPPHILINLKIYRLINLVLLFQLFTL